jgi:hypothetical protein
MSRILNQKRSGFISLMAVAAAVVMFVIGVGLLTLGFARRQHSIRSNNQISARSAADYGLTKAVYAMNIWARGPSTNPLPVETAVPITGSDIDGSRATYTYTVTKTGGIYSVLACGTSGYITKRVVCDLRLKSAYEYAILTKNNLDIGSCSMVNCIDCGAIPLKIGTSNNPNSNAQITLKPNSTVDGDILYGQGGNPNISNSATVSGGVYAVATDFDLPIPTLPDNFASGASNLTVNSSTTINTPGKYVCSTIDLKNGGTLKVNADVELYVTGDITLKNGADVNIAPGKKMTIYLNGAFDGYNGAGFNDGGDPAKLSIFGLGTKDIVIKNSDAFCGTIYAPNANVHLYNSAKVYGSIIANDYKQDNSAIFTYDAKLREINDVNLARFVPTHWREL